MNVRKVAESFDRRAPWRGWIQIATTLSAVLTLLGCLLYVYNAGAWAQRMESNLMATDTRVGYLEQKVREECISIRKGQEANKDHILTLETQRLEAMKSRGSIEAKLEGVSDDIKELKDLLIKLIRNGNNH